MVSSVITPLITAAQLQNRLDEMAAEVNAAYQPILQGQPLVLLGVLKGSFMLLSELAKRLQLPTHIEFIRLSSYEGGTRSTGRIRPVDLSLPPLTGAHVLIVEDFVDTGLTLQFLQNYLTGLHQPASLKTLTLLDKPAARTPETQSVQPNWTGFAIENQFVVGFGLDYNELYRNLPYIGVLAET